MRYSKNIFKVVKTLEISFLTLLKICFGKLTMYLPGGHQLLNLSANFDS